MSPGERRSWRRDGLSLTCALTFTASSLALDVAGILPGIFTRLFPTRSHYIVLPLVLGTTLGYLIWQPLRPRRTAAGWRIGLSSWRSIGRAEQSTILTDGRPLRAVALAVSVPLVLNTYSSWKTLIPVLNPFGLDEVLAHWDAVLHFGQDPWRLVQPVLGHHPITRLLDFLYYPVWMPLMPAFALWQAWSDRDDVRPRFFLTFALSWILLGVVAAVLLSSAGPPYYADVTGNGGRFADLFAYLESAGDGRRLAALVVQEFLWRAHTAELAVPFARISAMPSMHVAIATLYALTAAATSRWLGLVFSVYALAVLVGSVHLGWHYALDGYVSVIAVIGLWRLSGWLLRIPEQRAHPRPVVR